MLVKVNITRSNMKKRDLMFILKNQLRRSDQAQRKGIKDNPKQSSGNSKKFIINKVNKYNI